MGRQANVEVDAAVDVHARAGQVLRDARADRGDDPDELVARHARQPVRGTEVAADELMRVPCDLDLAAAEDREEAQRMYAEQAAAMRDALVGADTVLDIWREPLGDLAGAPVGVDRSIRLDVRLPAHRLLPAALVAPEKRIVVTAVCGARPLAEGRPPMGIACAQQDVVRVYPLPDDPERCLEDFLTLAAEHARELAEQLGRQEASVQRFLELSGEDFHQTG